MAFVPLESLRILPHSLPELSLVVFLFGLTGESAGWRPPGPRHGLWGDYGSDAFGCTMWPPLSKSDGGLYRWEHDSDNFHMFKRLSD